MNQEKHIPKILGLLILVGGTVAGIYLTNMNNANFSKAGSECKPVNPQITNITHQSIDISFTTSGSCQSTITIDNHSVDDIRKQNNPNFSSGQTHYFQVNNLKEKTEYKFTIISSGSNYDSDRYRVTTATKPTKPIPTSNLAWGKVLYNTGKPASDSILYFTVPGAAPLSSFITSSGNWNISLAYAFNEARNDWFTPQSNISEDIIVASPDSVITQVTANSSWNNPVPNIIVGQNYIAAPESPEPTESSSGNFNSNSNSAPTPTPNISLSISYPKDLEAIPNPRPEFSGNGPLKSSVDIKIEPGSSIKGSSSIDSSGHWRWTPSKDLLVGSYTLTVKLTNSGSTSQTLTRSFSIISSKDGIAFTASNSAQMVTSTPTSSPSPTTTIRLSPTPTVKSAKPTTTPRPPSPTKAPKATPSTLLKTGDTLPTYGLVTASIVIIILSLVIL